MRWFFVALLAVHGLLHLLGFAKAFGLAELAQLTRPVSKTQGILWLVATLAFLLTAVLALAAPRSWWALAFGAVALSQIAIVTAWPDAKFGTVANVLVLAGAVYGCASQGPSSFRAEYLREVRKRAALPLTNTLVREADLESLPEPVRRYLQVTGSVGLPRVEQLRATWMGRIRASADEPWMEFTAEQHNYPDEPARFFLMDATRSGLAVDVLHAFHEHAASMRVRLLSMFPLVDARGPELDRAETVTLLNDLCLLAPSALLGSAAQWEAVDEASARITYTVGSNTVSALVSFDESGELVDFVSNDRLAASSDGKQFTQKRWSTPVTEYRSFGRRRVFTRGEARWHGPEGAFSYLEIELVDLEVNGGPP